MCWGWGLCLHALLGVVLGAGPREEVGNGHQRVHQQGFPGLGTPGLGFLLFLGFGVFDRAGEMVFDIHDMKDV